VIYSARNYHTPQQNYISIKYIAENYSGYTYWDYNSSNGTSTTTNYASNNLLRTVNIVPDIFGNIEICGQLSNTNLSPSCVTINRVARLVEGNIISPANNSQVSTNYVQIDLWANNYTNGSISVNGVNQNGLDNSSNGNTTTTSLCTIRSYDYSYTRSCTFSLASGKTLAIDLETDSWGGEIGLQITKPDGTTDIWSAGSFSSQTGYTPLVTYTAAGNYTVKVTDTYGDGGANMYALESSNQTSNLTSGNVNIYLQLNYGMSTICLELEGEDGTEISDCIVVNRIIPTHSVTISYPNSNTSFTGENISLIYLLENSSMHYFTVDGVTTYASNSSWSSNQIQIQIGFGTHSICVVSTDYASQLDWDCIIVTMLNPNADFDSDGVVDLSDLCPHTPTTESANSDGCSTSQLDSDSDGVADNADICPATQQFSAVNSVGCSALQRDSDGDGVVDSMDACPSSPANSIVDAYGCSNTQTDSDNDGVVDASDMCPNTIVGSQVNANGCASSQLDSDSDGIVDSFDLCPSTSIGTVVDQTGCPYSTGGNSSGNNSGSTGGGSGGSSGGGLPAIGVVGTIAAIAIGFIFTTRREDEE
jgi:hypothetical protein